MLRYAVVIEKAARNFSAYFPDVPGCVATGATLEEVRRNLRAALRLHLDGMAEDGDRPPEPSSVVEYLEAEEPALPKA
jgi:predicted RNase H-like HicB family nuclease